MSNNIFIIGNGFDLSLGLPTTFKNFHTGHFWPDRILLRCSLQRYLDKTMPTEFWFDLERALAEYAKNDGASKDNEDNEEINDRIRHDREFFNYLQINLRKFIYACLHEHKNLESPAAYVLKAITSNKLYSKIYTFNYTPIDVLFNQMGITSEAEINYVHGHYEDGTLILGVDESKFDRKYDYLRKVLSPHYTPHSLKLDLAQANEVVVYGLSFSSIDYPYFDELFHNCRNLNQHITIITKDENSIESIKGNLLEQGVSLVNLMSTNSIEFITTDDHLNDNENKRLKSFIEKISVEV